MNDFLSSFRSTIRPLVGILGGIAWGAMDLSAATIVGTVYDADNDFFVEGALVRLEGTDRTTRTTRRGGFRFNDVPEGTAVVVVESVAYPEQRRELTLVDAEATATVDIVYTSGGLVELESFAVVGQAVSQVKSLSLRRASMQLQEVVSTDAFGQFADRNPAEALQRTAGVTVESNQGEGEFLIIRGLSPDLSSVQVDGVNLATPQEDGRRTNLNVITVDQIERIELSKTWLPYQKANVIGGTVNLVTRSALDRGRTFASVEVAGTHREIADKDSWRGAFTVGTVIDDAIMASLGERAIGVQFSVNQSEDHLGSDTMTWSWNGSKDFPFLSTPGSGQGRLRGFTVQNTNRRNYNVERERFGASGRIEFRLDRDHEFFAAYNHNRFDDTEIEHILNMSTQNLAQFYSGNTFLSSAIVDQLGLDRSDPFVAQRLALGAPNFGAAITYDEAIALGEIAFDSDLRMFTTGGRWGVEMNRTFVHTERTDQIDTAQLGGKHTFAGDLGAEWKVFQSEASQDQEQHWLRFSLEGTSGQGGVPTSGPGVANPYILDLSENPALFNARSFRLREPTTPNVGGTARRNDFLSTVDERRGAELDLKKTGFWSAFILETRVGVSLEEREKSYKVDNNGYGLAGRNSLDPTRWEGRQLTLDTEYFAGGLIEGFEDNFGEFLPFGPSFNEKNTIAFLRDPAAFGAEFGQDANHLNANFTDRVRTDYTAAEDILGGYFQQSIEWRQWMVIFGARYEETRNAFTTLEILTQNENPAIPFAFISPGRWRLLADREEFGEASFSTLTTTRKVYDHVLPALHVIRRIGENGNTVVRASVTQTIGRPLFTDLIPREIPSISGANFGTSIRLPAFDLRPMESTNYDLSIDHYFRPLGMISVALFHKDLNGPIYDEIRRGVGPNEETAPYAERYTSNGLNVSPYTLSQKKNAGRGEITGIEITFDRQLDFLPAFLDGFGVNSNIAWFDSEATLLTEGRAGEVVPLFKQPDMTANASLYYDKHKIFARLSYNVRGDYLNSIQAGTAPLADAEAIGVGPNAFDVYVGESHRWDLTVRYNLWKGVQVFFDAINLTNEPTTQYLGDRSRIARKQFTEQVFTLGLRWNL